MHVSSLKNEIVTRRRRGGGGVADENIILPETRVCREYNYCHCGIKLCLNNVVGYY